MHYPDATDDRSARSASAALAAETRHSAVLLAVTLGGMGGFAVTLLLLTSRLAG